MGRYDVLLQQEQPEPIKRSPQAAAKAVHEVLAPQSKAVPDDSLVSRSTGRPAVSQDNQPPVQSVAQSTSQSTGQSIGQSTKIVDRPKAFYITEQLDRRLDRAVRYLQE